MNKKWDEDLSDSQVVIVKQPSVEQSAESIDTRNVITTTGSLVIPFEKYLETVGTETLQLVKQHSVAAFPELFVVRGLENDKDSTVPVLKMSQPVKIFTALYEENFKSTMRKAKSKVIN